MKPFGFLQEDFHSEVLDFLFEIISNRDPCRKIILYNTKDRYDNKEFYKKKYKNLENRDLGHFVPDMISRLCEKVIVISYDNILNLRLFQCFKQDLIFIAHSPKHIKAYSTLNMEYFALTKMLSTNYMIPFVKDTSIAKQLCADISPRESSKNTLEHIKMRRDNEKMEIVTMIGNFLENNKDLDLITSLVSTGKFIFVIYATEMTETLYQFILEHKECVFAALCLSTSEIKSNINFLNAKYLLFAPPKESQFYTSSWSGSIAFAFDNDLYLIMPKVISDYYDISCNAIISYKTVDDILEQINLITNISEYENELQQIREKIYNRNCLIMDIICGKIKTSKLGNYRIEYVEEEPCKEIADDEVGSEVGESNTNKTINKYIKQYQNIFDFIGDIKDKINNTNIIDIEPNTNVFNLTCLLLESKCNMINFVEDLEKGKYYKDLATYNNFSDRIKIYNSIIGKKCKSDTVDTFTLDYLDLQNVSLIRMNDTCADDIISGAMKMITQQKPIILIKCQSNNQSNNNINLIKMGYKCHLIENYDLYMFN